MILHKLANSIGTGVRSATMLLGLYKEGSSGLQQPVTKKSHINLIV